MNEIVTSKTMGASVPALWSVTDFEAAIRAVGAERYHDKQRGGQLAGKRRQALQSHQPRPAVQDFGGKRMLEFEVE